jgi:hypothetical protein
MVHLGIQRPLGQRLLEMVQLAALIEGSTGFRAGQQLVQHHVRDMRRFATGHGGSSFFPIMTGQNTKFTTVPYR